MLEFEPVGRAPRLRLPGVSSAVAVWPTRRRPAQPPLWESRDSARRTSPWRPDETRTSRLDIRAGEKEVTSDVAQGERGHLGSPSMGDPDCIQKPHQLFFVQDHILDMNLKPSRFDY